MKVALLACMCVVMAACSSDSDDDNAVGSDDVRVAFTMSIAEAMPTRAANNGWADYDPKQDGTDEENMINTNDLHILVCDDGGNELAEIEDVFVSLVSDPDGKKYNITGTWRNAKGKLADAKKLMVVANCNAMSLATTPVASLVYDIDTGTRTFIPMWGVAPLPALTLGKSNPLTEDICMLRAMAKIKVTLRDDMKSYGFSIADMTLNTYNTRGYCLPRNFGSVSRTKDISFDNSLNPYDSKATSALHLADALPVYVPEYDNTTTGVTPSTITVNLDRNGSHEGTYTLHFCNYDSNGAPTGTPFDIQRNHLYTYIIYKENGQLLVSLHVRKWHMREHDEDIIM